MLRLIVTVACILVLYCLVGADGVVDNPSAQPLAKQDEYSTGERFRILGDVNLDGSEDLILSDDMATLGQGGIKFTIFLATDSNKFVQYDSYFGPLRIVSVEKSASGEIRFWTYGRINAQQGTLFCHTMGPDGFSDGQSIRILSGDGGSDIGRAMFDAVFKNSETTFKFQRSKTEGTTVHWSDY